MGPLLEGPETFERLLVSKRFLSRNVKELARAIYAGIGTPLSKGLLAALDSGDWDAIAQCKADPRAYTSHQEYFSDATAASLLRKCTDLPTTFDRRGAALESWRLGEVDCYRTNERLNPYLEGRSHPACDMDVARHIDGIRAKIERVLSERAPPMDALQPKHGPGATFSDKSTRSTLADKMESRASITHNALWFLLDWVGTAWGREALARDVSPSFVRGNRFTTAPKDATKDRPIAAEPSVNIFYQLALGGEIRRRLKRHAGIDLDYGQDVHRRLACEASFAGHLATLDLKNASDTVSYNLVKLLVPTQWFRLLDELRSPFTRMAGRDVSTLTGRSESVREPAWVKLEKFSSMGNGFTFELETLLFWAIADYACEQAVGETREKTLVYGDDIICDTRGVRAVTAALRFFGLTINEDKSFSSGDFRESCGGDFWRGRPVRPYFLKGPLDEPQQLIAAANQVRRVAQDLFGGLGPFVAAWSALQLQLPTRVRRCRGPERLGDAVIHDHEVNWGWTSRARDRVFAYIPVKHRKVSLAIFSEGTVFACGLYGVTVSGGSINPRDSVTGYNVRKLLIYGIDWVPQPRIVRGVKDATISDRPVGDGPNYSGVIRVVRRSKT